MQPFQFQTMHFNLGLATSLHLILAQKHMEHWRNNLKVVMVEIKCTQTLKIKFWSSSCKIHQMNMLITKLNFTHISAMLCLFIWLQSQSKKNNNFYYYHFLNLLLENWVIQQRRRLKYKHFSEFFDVPFLDHVKILMLKYSYPILS